MAQTAGQAPSTGHRGLQIGWRGRAEALNARAETGLEVERDQLMLWVPVMLGIGIAAWFTLSGPEAWSALILGASGIGAAAILLPHGGRLARVVGIGALLIATGCALIWIRSERAAAPVLARPVVASFDAMIERVERQPARERVRVRLAPIARDDLPPSIRVNIDQDRAPDRLANGAVVRLRARLMPPAPPAVPGAYDFQRNAWFQGLGATGRALGEVAVIRAAETPEGTIRARLTAHVQAQVGPSAGGVATALVTGDRGGISPEDDKAMQLSGLAHLLSISGLHVTAVVGATMLVLMRVLALFPALATCVRLPVVAAAGAGLVAIAYTLLSGAEVPTVRSCIAALLVLAALAWGREAITLRLVAAGATLVLLLWPEVLVGPSFQLSFAAVTAIVALHEHPRIKAVLAKRDEPWVRGFGRGLLGLLLTGLAVEAALTPIAVYHFRKSGIYGALANLVAIPLTTFVVMPLEALALFLDLFGLGAPAWWAAAQTLELLLWIAHTTANAPGSVALIPGMPGGAFALVLAGLLWLCLWKSPMRRWGAVPFLLGIIWTLATPVPDLLVTGDGRHLALRTPEGGMALLRERAGDYVRDTLSENAGFSGQLEPLSALPNAECSPDICIADHVQDGRAWRIVATRSGYHLDIADMMRLCREADIFVSERRLPRTCNPRWLKLDRWTLRETGGVGIAFDGPRVVTVRTGTRHPWIDPPTVAPPWQPRGGTTPAPGSGRNVR